MLAHTLDAVAAHAERTEVLVDSNATGFVVVFGGGLGAFILLLIIASAIESLFDAAAKRLRFRGQGR